MTGPIIQTPRGAIFQGANGKTSLKWSTSFQPVRQRQYTLAQKFMDSEILRGTEPYVPLLTGTLIKTGILGTDVGSGLVQWIAPYAKAQYYRPKPAGSQTGPLRGPFWFERWKASHGRMTVYQARKLAGRG
jgi:hypothetical protein